MLLFGCSTFAAWLASPVILLIITECLVKGDLALTVSSILGDFILSYSDDLWLPILSLVDCEFLHRDCEQAVRMYTYMTSLPKLA